VLLYETKVLLCLLEFLEVMTFLVEEAALSDLGTDVAVETLLDLTPEIAVGGNEESLATEDLVSY